MSMDKALVGLFGVYQVAAQLCWMGYNAVPTSRNTKSVDLIVHNPTNDKSVGVQVKTIRQQSKKNPSKDLTLIKQAIPEEIENLRVKFTYPFVFVYIPRVDKEDERPIPRFFIVPKEDVFKLCKEQWEIYATGSKHRSPIEDIAKRYHPLSISLDQLRPYENRWDYLGLGT